MTREFIEGRLFKPFSTTKSGGFGIGLYQVKGIVEAHGGKIEVESDVGRGASFRVLLPKEPQNHRTGTFMETTELPQNGDIHQNRDVPEKSR
jgi:nitrogen-specific signal transduction histidine kinase